MKTKYLNMFENDFDFRIKGITRKSSICRVFLPNRILRMVQRQKRKHSQELLRVAQRLVGVKGWCGSGFGKVAKRGTSSILKE